jgi:hypothetical protein
MRLDKRFGKRRSHAIPIPARWTEASSFRRARLLGERNVWCTLSRSRAPAYNLKLKSGDFFIPIGRNPLKKLNPKK